MTDWLVGWLVGCWLLVGWVVDLSQGGSILGFASALGSLLLSLLPTSSAEASGGPVPRLLSADWPLRSHSTMADYLAAATEEPSAHAVSLDTRVLLL